MSKLSPKIINERMWLMSWLKTWADEYVWGPGLDSEQPSCPVFAITGNYRSGWYHGGDHFDRLKVKNWRERICRPHNCGEKKELFNNLFKIAMQTEE